MCSKCVQLIYPGCTFETLINYKYIPDFCDYNQRFLLNYKRFRRRKKKRRKYFYEVDYDCLDAVIFSVCVPATATDPSQPGRRR